MPTKPTFAPFGDYQVTFAGYEWVVVDHRNGVIVSADHPSERDAFLSAYELYCRS